MIILTGPDNPSLLWQQTHIGAPPVKIINRLFGSEKARIRAQTNSALAGLDPIGRSGALMICSVCPNCPYENYFRLG